VDPLSAACGAIVKDPAFNLSMAENHSGIVRDIEQAVSDHLVVAIPDQDLSPADLSRLAGEFGQICQAPFLREVDGAPGVIEVKREPSEEGMPFFAGNWHSDWSFMEVPPSYSLLYSLDVPPIVGSTLWANQQLAHENLSPGMKKFLAEIRVVHTAGPSLYEQRRTSVKVKLEESIWDEVEHPAVIQDAVTGKHALFLNDAYCKRIADWTVDESQGLLRYLFDWQTMPEFQCRLHWKPNMLVLWDNRTVSHRVMHDYDGTYRRMLRATVRSRDVAA
jgi:taurine dioxygenase